MDSRLQRVGGTRLVHLRYSDAPRVAQALVDALGGRARVLSGQAQDVPYVEFVRDQAYTVVIRGDDWRRIFPFLRYGTSLYRPVDPPPNQPAPIPSPQPNRVMQPPPENPSGGLVSFLEGLPFDEYSKIQDLLTMFAANPLEAPAGAGKPLRPEPNPPSLLPPEVQSDGVAFRDTDMYNRFVIILQRLFPTDFPTRY